MRWSDKENKKIEAKLVDAFLNEVHAVCKKHGFCIEHEDSHGGFLIEKYDDEKDFEWLGNASVGKTIDDA